MIRETLLKDLLTSLIEHKDSLDYKVKSKLEALINYDKEEITIERLLVYKGTRARMQETFARNGVKGSVDKCGLTITETILKGKL